eukprot:TRINITY_DN3886_c0_g2_i1.p1 TRINITY_DN3886_c0_g2~~TRINITY_DN3886_c0_g2_i1.p1  ORF type:complete len:319 (+),score=75.64 TRINITY_DN3886_c0_g2_i1:56-1012(+)
MSLANPNPTEKVNDYMGVAADFEDCLRSDPGIALAVAAVKALTNVITKSEATTYMEMEIDLNKSVRSLRDKYNSSISLVAGCDLFMRFVSKLRTEFDYSDFEHCKKALIERGHIFTEASVLSRSKIAILGEKFIRDGFVLLTHGFSRTVNAVLVQAIENGKRFKVIVTESRPNSEGQKTADVMKGLGVPVTVILDSAVGFYMSEVDMVLVGAECLVENGGIVNKIGTYQMAIVAQSLKKPLYVAAESYKFARMYPLSQKDIPQYKPDIPENASALELEILGKSPSIDYTPPAFINLLFTDLGVLTPSAVSDELIKLFV